MIPTTVVCLFRILLGEHTCKQLCLGWLCCYWSRGCSFASAENLKRNSNPPRSLIPGTRLTMPFLLGSTTTPVMPQRQWRAAAFCRAPRHGYPYRNAMASNVAAISSTIRIDVCEETGAARLRPQDLAAVPPDRSRRKGGRVQTGAKTPIWTSFSSRRP